MIAFLSCCLNLGLVVCLRYCLQIIVSKNKRGGGGEGGGTTNNTDKITKLPRIPLLITI